MIVDDGSTSLVFRDEEGCDVAAVDIKSKDAGWGPFRLSPEEAFENAEAETQLVEGGTYHFRLSSEDWRLQDVPGLVESSLFDETVQVGRITPRLCVGTIRLSMYRKASPTAAASAQVEVRSAKLDYREHYREMLRYISERCADLFLEFRSTAEQSLLPDEDRDPETVVQRFAFVRALVSSAAFREAIDLILAQPHRRLALVEREVSIRRGIGSVAGLANQLARGQKRVSLPDGHPLRNRAASLPERVVRCIGVEETDTPENRFIKHAISDLRAFAASVRERLDRSGRKWDRRFAIEARALEEWLGDVLDRDLFRSTSEPDLLPLGSPVLQRRSGYHEVLRGWLHFNVAARLCWTGGDEVYGAGKRDVARLYEYWVFFKLLGVISDVFALDRPPIEDLIEQTEDGFGLKLKAGRHLAIAGTSEARNHRRLCVRFSYNRTFVRRGGGGSPTNFPAPGTWTTTMRPDYTLSLWPEGVSESEAELQEAIVHIHFDAKYRVDRLVELFGRFDDEELPEDDVQKVMDEEKLSQDEGRYSRGDLLKMHAYRDAIRRTYGAYVLYPGVAHQDWRGFHEIIPGMGAFGLRPTPSADNDGTKELSAFLVQVVDHLWDRASRREREAYHRYVIQDPQDTTFEIRESPMTEYQAGGRRVPPPRDVSVLVAFYKSDSQLHWTENEGLVIVRTGERHGALPLSPKSTSVRFVLLHTAQQKLAAGLYEVRVDDGGEPIAPEIVPARVLKEVYRYPLDTGSDYYLMYRVHTSPAYRGARWDIESVFRRKGEAYSPVPFCIGLDEVLASRIAG